MTRTHSARLALALGLIWALAMSCEPTGKQAKRSGKARTAAKPAATVGGAKMDPSPVIGPEDAPVVIVEVSDFQ